MGGQPVDSVHPDPKFSFSFSFQCVSALDRMVSLGLMGLAQPDITQASSALVSVTRPVQKNIYSY